MCCNEIENYVITLYTKRYIVQRFTPIILNNIEYIFLGIINKHDIIPRINCIYITNNREIIKKTINSSKTIRTYENNIEFEVDGVFPKGRPRFRRFGKFVSVYTDSKTLKGEQTIQKAFKNIKNLPQMAHDTPVELDIEFQMGIPSSLSKKKQELLIGIDHLKKSDIDNLCKSVLDALNKVAYTDDAIISRLSCNKIYAIKPKTVVKIRY